MSRLSSMNIDVRMTVPEGHCGRLEGLWALVTANGKTLGKARVDKNGAAAVKCEMAVEKPVAVDVTVSPFSRLVRHKRVRTESIRISSFKKKGTVWEAEASIVLTPIFMSSVSWLDELFTVNGRLISRYTDPETAAVIESPVRHAMVKLYDVDIVRIRTGWCVPDVVVCKPVTAVCLPSLAEPVCKPVTVEVCTPLTFEACKPAAFEVCKPLDVEVCTPSVQPECGPWVEGPIIDHDIRVRPGCCGAETPARFKGLAYRQTPMTLKPASSPALAGKTASLAQSATARARGLYLSFNTRHPLGTECETDDSGHFGFTFRRSDFFEAPAGSTHTENVDWDEYPDLLFEANLFIDGEFRTIYKETYSAARWDVTATSSYVELVIDGKLPGCDPGDDIDISQSEEFLFHNIGNVEPGWIDVNGVISNAPAGTGLDDHVFGGSLDIFAQFNYSHVGKYYQVEYQRQGDANWYPILGQQWYYSHYLGNGTWETLRKEPSAFPGYPACYRIPDYADITLTKKTLLIHWSTFLMDGNIRRYPNGLYHLRVRLLRLKADGTVEPEPGFDVNGSVLDIRTDNDWPLADIDPVMYLGESNGTILNITPVPECGMVQRGPSRFLLLHFQAEDPENHLWTYDITVNRGGDGAVVIPDVNLSSITGTNPALPDFNLQQSSYLYVAPGSNFTSAYAAMSLSSDPWGLPALKPCAYNFTLSVWDRVTNGYGRIHLSQHTMTLTILA